MEDELFFKITGFLGKTCGIMFGITGAMIICLVSEVVLGSFIGHGISFLMFPINYIFMKGMWDEYHAPQKERN